MPREKFIALNTCDRKSHINNLSIYLKKLQKEEQNKTNADRSKIIIKIKSRNQKLKTEKIKKINETQYCFFENTNNIDKPLASLTK